MLSHERRFLPFVCGIAAAVSFAWFLYDGVARVWSGVPPDFPNYYAAARSTVNGTPLQAFYSYPDFQREIDRAGIDRQLGGYIPQTPLAVLPLLPLTGLAPIDAKRVWLVLNLSFLILTLWLFSRMTTFSVAQAWLIVFGGYLTLRQNFWLGQYYVFLLAMLTIAAWCLLRSRERPAAATLATAFVLKLYGAPFFLFLAAKRRFRTLVPLIVALLFFAALQIAIFGWHGTVFYLTQVLPRSLEGQTLNPYQSANNTFITLFRTLLIREPSLNPSPLLDSPAAFAFLQCAFTLSVLLLPALAAWSRPGPATKTDLAWWSITLLLVSPNTASYTFVLLALPAVLLLDVWPMRRWPYILVPCFLLALPLRASASPFFPRAWLLLFLFVVVGREYFRSIHARPMAWSIVCILTLASGAAIFAAQLHESPADSATEIALQSAAVYSDFPIVTASGILYESIAPRQYVVERWDGAGFEAFGGDGDSFYPSTPDSGSRVYFEMFSGGRSSVAYFDFLTRQYGAVATIHPNPAEPSVSHDGSMLALLSNGALYVSDGTTDRRLNTSAPTHDPAFAPGDKELLCVTTDAHGSQIVRIDLNTGNGEALIGSHGDLAKPSISPDRTTLAYASRQAGAWQIWTKSLTSGRMNQVTSGRCNSTSPAWTLDSTALIFASDCRRGLNLPALFRMSVNGPHEQ
jgi:Glycosyltransferase family 87/WD40-like Beta Propeller Repeat